MKKHIGILIILIVLVGIGYAYYASVHEAHTPTAPVAQATTVAKATPSSSAVHPVMPQIVQVNEEDAPDFVEIHNSLEELSYLGTCLQGQTDVLKGYHTCVCAQQDQKAISILKNWKRILAKHPVWTEPGVTLNLMQKPEITAEVSADITSETALKQRDNVQFQTQTLALNSAALISILEATKDCVSED